MRIWVVYDSFFGNTEKIAKTVAGALNEKHQVEIMHINQFQPSKIEKIDLLIMGSPTRAFEPTKPVVQALKGIKKENNPKLSTAVFDTRIDVAEVNNKILNIFVKFRGYANDTMVKILEKKGIKLASRPGEFFVNDTEGPLRNGEMQNAEIWAHTVVEDAQK